MTSVLVSYKPISYLKENIKFKLSTPYGEQQKAPWYYLVRIHTTPVAYGQVIELPHQEYFLRDTDFDETFWLLLIGFGINVKYKD